MVFLSRNSFSKVTRVTPETMKQLLSASANNRPVAGYAVALRKWPA
jgi:hypothetical protein